MKWSAVSNIRGRARWVAHTDCMTTAERPLIFNTLVDEIRQHYHAGRILIAIDGADERATGHFADSLAVAMRARSQSVVRVTSATDAAAGQHDLSFPRYDTYRPDDDNSRLQSIVSRFRGRTEATDSAEVVPDDSMLIVAGRFLLRPELRGFWHFSVWLEGDSTLSQDSLVSQIRYTRDNAPRGAANAIFDITNAAQPVRVWADSC